MTFSEQLNIYINKFECTSKDLALVSGLSSTVISRYKNGERTPNINSDQFERLVSGLYELSVKSKSNIPKDIIRTSLVNTLNGVLISPNELGKNFNALILALNISITDLSRYIGYDASFISKIRVGTRTPSKPQDFIDAVCNFISSKYKNPANKETISSLIDCSKEDLEDDKEYFNLLKKWFSNNSTDNISQDRVSDFLKNLDEFNLEEYIDKIHFNDLKIPFVPFYKAISKNYYGIEEMKKGELDFFKATVLSKSTEPVFMCSDMPMEDMAKDIDFGKKWMFAIAMTLKKGLHLNIIHNLNRPFNEMMLGLESWVPIYMTGQVSPYYLKNYQDDFYSHLNYVSGSVALVGECINGCHEDGKYYLTSSKSEVDYYKNKDSNLLKKASPLMNIYTKDSCDEYNAFLFSSTKCEGTRKRILPFLPIHTISDSLLESILNRNNIPKNEIENIKKSVNRQKDFIKKTTELYELKDEIPNILKEEFEKVKPYMSLCDSFYEKKVYYTYTEYIEHLSLTQKFCKNNSNYSISYSNNHPFKNIRIFSCGDEWIMVSKANSPSIHFVIKHAKLKKAIEEFVPPVVE